jgi:methyl-accepting chemotaxis protein
MSLAFLAKKSSFANTNNNIEAMCAALDSMSARVMIADNNRVIVYANPAVVNFLREVEADIRRDLPNFAVDKLVGTNIDTFHKNPAHQQGMIAGMRGPYDTSIRVGGKLFSLRAAPLYGPGQARIGTMVEWQDSSVTDNAGQVEAIGRSQAVIHFNLDGTIQTANENFLKTMGYSLDEIRGKHHSMFADPAFAASPEYQEFWRKLNNGEYVAGEFRRLAKGGREVWIQASYNPIMDNKGKPFKVVKYAADITAEKLKNADFAGQIAAIGKAQACIEFNLDGTIITANPNFLGAVGYSLEEIKGKHHRMFVEAAEAQSSEYAAFWDRLRAGQFDTRVYKRITKSGEPIWIQASYNPIMDMNGKPFKVVKFATDVTKVIQIAAVSEEASASTQTVAAAIEEMAASIGEISKNMQQTTEATGGITSAAASASAAADQLLSTTKAMENIIQLIEAIAGQTNLLALNATIEAARAGDAGKGFAVVANEVKNLAAQTAQATENVAKEIKNVQQASQALGGNIVEIANSVDVVNKYASSVAGAIEEQSAVTKEISSSTQRMAGLVEDIGQRVKSLTEK